MLLSNGGKISVMSCMQTFKSECLIPFSPSNLKWYTECQRLFHNDKCKGFLNSFVKFVM